MNIYLISQNENDDYDTYDSAIVTAESEEEARKIIPGNGKWGDWCLPWCSRPDLVSVTLIGIATGAAADDVVLASFNAG